MKNALLLVTATVICFFTHLQVNAFNNDGKPDIVWRNYWTDANEVWLMNDTTQSGTAPLVPVGNFTWNIVGTADFNGDGQLDLLLYSPSDGHIGYWYMNGTNLVRALDLLNANPPIFVADPTTWEVIGCGYFGGAGDTHPDLLLHNKQTGEVGAWMMVDSSFQAGVYLTYPDHVTHLTTAYPWTYAVTGDFDNDGKTDIILRDTLMGQNGVWRMDGTAYVTTTFLPTEPYLDWNIVGANHFNSSSDSSLDLLWRYRTTGDMHIWLLNGTSLQSTVSLPTRAGGWQVVATGDSRLDLDRDGLPDIWELGHFGNMNQTGNGDFDGDHFTNLQEYQNGTDPTAQNLAFVDILDIKGAAAFGELDYQHPPDTMGAIGPNHFLEVLNNVVVVFDRTTGQRVASISQSQFFTTPDGLHVGGADAHVIYDSDLQRWVAVALEGYNRDKVIFAISNNSDPVGSGTGDWVHAQWVQYSRLTASGAIADYPTLGLDGNGIYIVVNAGHPSANYVLLAIPKTATLRTPGGAPTFSAPLDMNPPGRYIQPALNFDTVGPSDPALFITQDGQNSSSRVLVGRVTWSNGVPIVNPSWPAVSLLQPGADLGWFKNGTYPLNPLTQGSGTSRVGLHSVGSNYIMAMVRNGYFWTCHTIQGCTEVVVGPLGKRRLTIMRDIRLAFCFAGSHVQQAIGGDGPRRSGGARSN